MATLELPVYNRRGQIGTAIIRDDAFGRELAERRWNSSAGYIVTGAPGGIGLVFLHKLVYAHYHGTLPPGQQIDHKNRNKRDNTPENLRPATRSVQGANKGKIKSNKSGYSGVSWDAKRKKWNAIFQYQGKSRRLGRYSTREEAAAAVARQYRIFFPDVRHQSEIG